MENLSTVLTHLMSINGLNSAELARKTQISQPVVHRLMTGSTSNPQILTLKPIADFFGVTIDQLLGYSPLGNYNHLDNTVFHNITNKLTTIKTIASVLINILPELIHVYQKAISNKLTKEIIPETVLPLVQINIHSLVTAANQIQESLKNNQDSAQ